MRTIIVGCNGRMGGMLNQIISADADMEIVAGVDLADLGKYDYPVFPSIAECNVDADVVIDFSNAKISDQVMDDCAAKKLPLVLCTTGLSAEQLAHLDEAAKVIPVLQSANMSLGINTLKKVLSIVSPVLKEAGFDIEIVERHHNQKLDAPSGTAILLANAVNDSLEGACHYVYDRSQVRQKRDGMEIGISAVRGGTIVGDHEVIYAGQDEVLEFSHHAYSRAVFAKGAVQAAKFLVKSPVGRYDMNDVIG
ncbi:MAG: 4-hydroxy-tetrahydrodipicolinate reductase [Lachnospiraceae bacterium]